jgi:crotonobetainyl-CoA:carnitine CoA-transferase CaiB-like acyl-CoA transferase
VREICEIIGLPDLSVDPRFDTYAKRATNQGAFEAMIEEALTARTTDEWLAVMEPADIFAARVNTLRDAVADPQSVATGRVVTVESPDGPLRLIAPPARFGRTPLDIRQAPPRHGEHTEQIRRELGLDRADAAGTAGGRR